MDHYTFHDFSVNVLPGLPEKYKIQPHCKNTYEFYLTENQGVSIYINLRLYGQIRINIS